MLPLMAEAGMERPGRKVPIDGEVRETREDLKSSWPAAACRCRSQESVTLSLGFSIFLKSL